MTKTLTTQIVRLFIYVSVINYGKIPCILYENQEDLIKKIKTFKEDLNVTCVYIFVSFWKNTMLDKIA